MADETPRRLKRFERRGEMPPSEEIPQKEEISDSTKQELLSKPAAEKSYEEEEEEMAEQLAEESSAEEEIKPAKPKRESEEDREGMIEALGKRSEAEVHEELAKQELGKFKDKFNRMPATEEDYNAIAEAIFEQIQLKGEGQPLGELKPEEKSGEEPHFGTSKAEEPQQQSRKIRRRGRQAEESQEQIQSNAQVAEEIPEEKASVSDLFGEKKKTAKKKSASELEEESEDNDLDSLEEEGEENLEDLSSLEEGESEGEEDLSFDEGEEEEDTCPNCEKPTDEVIYCSSCGAAFCDSCAKAKEKFPDKIKYTCPHCGAKIDKAIKK